MLAELLQAAELPRLFESFYDLTRIPVAIIDLRANVLLSSRWQRICVQFHRVNPDTCRRCIESDRTMPLQLQEGRPFVTYPCDNGLTDCAAPIILEGRHVANVFIGQFLTSAPDESRFRRQAEEFGFPVDDYLAALRELPIIDEQRIRSILDLLSGMTSVITRLSVERKRVLEVHSRQTLILDAIPQGVFWKDLEGRYRGCNARFARAMGLASPSDVVGKADFELPWPRHEADAYRADDEAVVKSNAPRMNIIEAVQRADGSRFLASTSKIPLVDAGGTVYGIVGVFEDITERRRAEDALRRSEQRFRQAFMTGLDAFYIGTLDDGVLLDVNDEFVRIYGYPREELLGQRSRKLWHRPEDRAALVERLKADGFVKNLEVEARRKDGTIIVTSLSIGVLAGTEPTQILGVVRDITEQKRAGEALDERLRTETLLAEIAASFVNVPAERLEEEMARVQARVCETFSIDASGLWLTQEANELRLARAHWVETEPLPESMSAKAMFPWCLQQVQLGRSVVMPSVDLAPFEARQDLESWKMLGIRSCYILPLTGPEGRFLGVLSFNDTHGERVWTADLASQLQLVGKLFSGALLRRESELALRESEARFRSLSEDSLLGIYVIQDGRLAYVNPSLARTFECSPSDLIGTDPQLLIAPEDKEFVAEHMRRRMAGIVDGILRDISGQTRTGAIRQLQILGSLTQFNGRPAIMGNLLDVTEQRQLEQQFLQAQKMEGIGLLAGGIAHDFNNLLNVILGYTGFVLQAPELTAKARDDLGEVWKAAEKAAALTRHLLAFGRKQILQPVPLDLNQVAAGFEKMLRRIVGEDIDLRLNLAEGLGLTMADPGQMEQVIMNLVVNARDAMPEGGVLTIATASVEVDLELAASNPDLPPGPYVVLSVTDTGTGMDDSTKARLFEPFFTTKAKGKGTGLGLPTVYGIITQSGGAVMVESQLGRGTTFKVFLPRLDVSAMPVVAASSSSTTHGSAIGGTETILLVEDEPALRKAIVRSLEAAGYGVLTAGDGEEALRVARSEERRIHLLLTDVVMPRMSGPTMAKELRRTRPETRVLYMSGYADSEIVAHGALVAGTLLLAKPFRPADLTRRVREVLDEGNAGPPGESAAKNLPGGLPADFLLAFRKAVIAARDEDMRLMLEQLSLSHPNEAAALRGLVDQFDYDGILACLESSAAMQ